CEVIACEVWGIFESALNNIEILAKFWEFLDRPPPLNPVQASYFAKVIGVFLMKKTGEMLQFIRSQPEVVPKLLLHMSTSSIMDLLLKIISMEESPDGKGTVQWLSEQGLMPWLVNRLDPNFDAEVHSIASQVLLDIIAISQSSHPEQPSIGTNVLIDELKSEMIVTQLVEFMLERDAPYSSSTLINGVTIFIELIRRNNSDYDVEPLPPNSTEPACEVVDLSDLLKVLASRIEDFRDLLIVPRSVTGPIDTSIGKQTPLGFERLKICEMFAELLHCSNMAVLNSRPIISVSADGTVRIPCVSTPFHHINDSLPNVGSEPHLVNGTHAVSAEDSAKSESGKSKEVEQGAGGANSNNTSKENGNSDVAKKDDSATPRASPSLGPTTTATNSVIASNTIATLTSTNSIGSDDAMIPVGDFLKLQFVDHRIITTCFDLFFQFPWNNFLHTVVYDMVHQVFHRPMGDIGRPGPDGVYIPPKGNLGITEGWNRRLTISIFKDGQLTKRITDAQRLCDYECAQPKGVRLGYMGHLTYIADETVRLLELYSQTSLLPMLYEYIDLEDWWNYVSKILKETKERDALVLGGSRPNVIESHKSGLDDANDDYMDDNDEFGDDNDFLGGDSGTGHEGDVASDQFARYLCQQITNNLPDKFGSSDEDDDEEEGNWIGEYGANSDFDAPHANAASGLVDPFGGDRAPDFDSDDEDDEAVDEETWNQPWPGASVGEAKGAEVTHQTSTEWSGETQDSAVRSNTTQLESVAEHEHEHEHEHEPTGANASAKIPSNDKGQDSGEVVKTDLTETTDSKDATTRTNVALDNTTPSAAPSTTVHATDNNDKTAPSLTNPIHSTLDTLATTDNKNDAVVVPATSLTTVETTRSNTTDTTPTIHTTSGADKTTDSTKKGADNSDKTDIKNIEPVTLASESKMASSESKSESGPNSQSESKTPLLVAPTATTTVTTTTPSNTTSDSKASDVTPVPNKTVTSMSLPPTAPGSDKTDTPVHKEVEALVDRVNSVVLDK
ncbi:hypothetical protein BGZ94_000492, partial [Podila epigama]